jgi:hypothetical protein
MMKTVSTTTLFSAVALSCFCGPRPLVAQRCQDEEAMVADYRKGLTELVETTRKESQADFEKGFHQKTSLTKLGLSLSMVNELVACLEKASADSAATKDQVEAYKAKLASYTKLKDKLEENRKVLKAADDAKTAKAVVEKLRFSD